MRADHNMMYVCIWSCNMIKRHICLGIIKTINAFTHIWVLLFASTSFLTSSVKINDIRKRINDSRKRWGHWVIQSWWHHPPPPIYWSACSNTVISQVYFETLGGYSMTRQFKMISNIGVVCEKIISQTKIYGS